MSDEGMPLPWTEREVDFPSLDGLRLRGTLASPAAPTGPAPVILVHGGGVTRDEGGFFTALARQLAAAGLPCLRFDLRGHGASQGRQEDLTLASVLNDIRGAVDALHGLPEAPHSLPVAPQGAVNLLGTSFAGGIAAYFAAVHPASVRRLVLCNPLLEYKKRFIDDKPYWHEEHLDAEAAAELNRRGFLAHSPSFRLGRALLNEIFYLRPEEVLGRVQAPTLFLHGTADTFVSVESSRHHVGVVAGPARLIEIEGAQHGFAVPEDPAYRDPQTQLWHAQVIGEIVAWFAAG